MSLTPDAIDALLARVAAVLPASLADPARTVQLFDGPEAEWPEQEFVAIGLSPEDLETPSRREPAGPFTTGESADITSLIRAWNGSTDIRTLRVRTYALLDLIRAELERDNTLGGVVGQAELTGDVYVPGQGRRGALVDVIFTVRVLRF